MGFRRVTKGKPWPPVALWRPLKNYTKDIIL